MSILKDNVNTGPAALRASIRRSCVAAPGVFNGISALLAEREGFKALYLSGSGVAGRAGLPDISVTTLDEVSSEVREIARVARPPIIADVDTGFGEVVNVIRTIREMEAAGASAVHIEDQVLPKRCGHLAGKELVSAEEMVRKIRAAVSARKNDDFMIIARTDARAVEGFDGAVDRARQYVEAGADAIFPEAMESMEEFARFPKLVKAPLLANMTEFGKSPLLSVKELDDMGYKIVIFPLTAFRASLKVMEEVYGELWRKGTQRGSISKLMTRDRFYEVIGYHEYEEEDRMMHTGGKSSAKKRW